MVRVKIFTAFSGLLLEPFGFIGWIGDRIAFCVICCKIIERPHHGFNHLLDSFVLPTAANLDIKIGTNKLKINSNKMLHIKNLHRRRDGTLHHHCWQVEE